MPQVSLHLGENPWSEEVSVVGVLYVSLCLCGEVKDIVGALTPVVSGVAQVFHVLLVELRLLVAEVEEGDRQEEG